MSRVWPYTLTLLLAATLSLTPFAAPARAAGGPRLDSLRLVARLPPELPQRVSSIAHDGKKLWVMVYHGAGRHALLDPSTLTWELSEERNRHEALAELGGPSKSTGGVCFAGERLWVGGSYGDTLGHIDTRDWKVGRVFKGSQRADDASQGYAGLACDGRNIWVAWHWFRYDIPATQTQLLLKVEPESGNVLAQFPLPAGKRNDGTHGLTWDGARLWHAKGRRLSAIDPNTGFVTTDHMLPGVRRASGLAWDGGSLWIAEFDGKIWRLDF